MAHASTDRNYLADPDLRESLRVIRRQRAMQLTGVAVALIASIGVAIAYASLSYSDRDASIPTHPTQVR